MEDIATNEFANGHGQVGNQSNASNANAGVMFVGGSQVHVVVVVMVVVAMATMAPGLCHGEWCYRGKRTRSSMPGAGFK